MKFGYELLVGTVVYYFDISNPVANPIRRSTIGLTSDEVMHYRYIYKNSDGLYATFSTRRIWEQNVCFHPHCTLFKMLHEKLKI